MLEQAKRRSVPIVSAPAHPSDSQRHRGDHSSHAVDPSSRPSLSRHPIPARLLEVFRPRGMRSNLEQATSRATPSPDTPAQHPSSQSGSHDACDTQVKRATLLAGTLERRTNERSTTTTPPDSTRACAP